MASAALTAEDYAYSRLVSYAAYQWPSYRDAHHHRLIARHLEMVERGEIKRLMITMPPRHGKALHVDTPIPTPTGWRRIADLRAGDQVFGADGKPCNVVAVSEVWRRRPVYRVITDDRDEIIADAEHEWNVRLCRKRPVFHNKTTAQLAARKSARAPLVRKQGALVLPDRDLPIDPYLLGMWLGDGTSLDAAITCHVEDQPHIRGRIEASGVATKQRSVATLFGVSDTWVKLRSLGLVGNKHIPEMYLFASKAQRLNLLQGLIDSDGHVAKDGQVEFCNTNRILAEQVRQLVSSLGVKAAIIEGRATLYGKDCGPKYRVMFYMTEAASLPRKAIRCRDGVKQPNRYLQKIEPAGYADTVCIQVDTPDHLFLCGHSMLPTHNSMMASEFFPAWYLGRNPDHYVVAATYAQDLADDFGRKVRNQIADPGYQRIFPGVGLKQDSASSRRFHVTLPNDAVVTGQNGAYFAVGVGGPLTGRGAHLLLIDDPVKNREDADSEISRRKMKDWYTSTAYTRLMPGGRVVVIQTRWHMDDLSGWLLEDHAHEGWVVLNLPAISDDGQPLWPEQYSLEALEAIKRALPARDWSALYQQRPQPDEGSYFRREWFTEWDKLPAVRYYGTSDYAVTDGGGDFTVHCVWAIGPDGNIYRVDRWRGQTSSDIWIERKLDLIAKYKPIAWFGEGGVIQKAIEPMLKRRMRERNVFCRLEWLSSVADKPTRARSFQAMAASGRVKFEKGADLSEFLVFPAGKHDDEVDTASLIGRAIDQAHPAIVQDRPKDKPKDAWARAFRERDEGTSWKAA